MSYEHSAPFGGFGVAKIPLFIPACLMVFTPNIRFSLGGSYGKCRECLGYGEAVAGIMT